VIPIRVPPLRERPEDVRRSSALREAVRVENNFGRRPSTRAIEALSAIAWRGNVRELKNTSSAC
jgi:transcriptional regulator with GAF, ATPase, and Fis domain